MAYTRQQLIELVQRTAQQYGIDPGIAVAQISAESGFNPNAGSGKGAQGLAQFMPDTWKRFGIGSPFDPDAAVQAWGKYMSYLLGMFSGRYDIALAGYNSGENRAEYRNAAAQGRPINWEVFNTPQLRGVYTETRNYVSKILGASATAIPTNGTDAISQTFDDAPDEGSGLFLPIAIGAVLLLLLFSD